jgi:beta-fructofuranosidase
MSATVSMRRGPDVHPAFHFTAQSGWINDPHGITYRDGTYHLFYQYVPGSTVWAPNCHWGHATSADLLTFDDAPVALAPGDGDDGIWTGSLVTDDAGHSTIFYTSVVQPAIGIGRVRTAEPVDDSWRGWRKGPVVAEPPQDLEIIAYRDPFVFRDGEGWRMFLGAGLADGRATALSYASSNLLSWQYEGIAAERSTTEHEPVWTGALWECPQLFEVDGRHVMVTSVWDDDVLHYVAYGIGSYRDGHFEASTWGRLSYGDSYYAPSFFRDADGRPSLMFWLRHVEDPAAGWASAHSLPHTLTLDGDVLVATPHPGLEAHRVAAMGPVDGSAADVVWSPGTHLNVSSGSRTVAEIAIGDDGLRLTVGDASWGMPYDGGLVRIIIDGPVLELSTRSGVLAAPIGPPAAGVTIAADGTWDVYALTR